VVVAFAVSAQASLITSFTSVTSDGNGSSAGIVNFTAANTIDWAYFDGDNDTDANLLTASDYSAEPATRLISDLSVIGSPTIQDSAGAHRFTWDNGVNTAVVTDGNTRQGAVQTVANLGDGYNWTVTPSAMSDLVVDVYAGVFRAEGTLVATIVDGTGTQVGGTTPQSIVWSLDSGARLLHATLDVSITDADHRVRFDLTQTADLLPANENDNVFITGVGVIPEPSSLALGTGALLLLWACRRRKA
jgi:hypothetical protein